MPTLLNTVLAFLVMAAIICFGLASLSHRALKHERIDFVAFQNHTWAFEVFGIVGLCFMVCSVALGVMALAQ